MSKARRITVKVQRLLHARGLPLPSYQSAGAAGLDLVAAIEEDAPVELPPGQRAVIPAGLVLELPAGIEAQVRPRSGLAAKHGLTVLNSPGTIDSDYRGEVAVILINHGEKPFTIRRGERIAQMVIAEVRQVRLVETVNLSATARGGGGFGSTGQETGSNKKKVARVRAAEKTASRKRALSKKRAPL